MATRTIPNVPVEKRERLGSNECRRLRKDGKLPMVVYGHQIDPVHVATDYKAFIDILHHGARLVEVALDGKNESCLVKDVQWDSLGRGITHVDLTRVDLSEEITVEVDIELTGEPAALKSDGTMLDQPLTRLEITCRADAIPDSIKVNIEQMELGDTLLAGDVPLSAGVTLETDESTLVAALTEVRVAEEAEEEVEGVAEEGAEPEVIGRKEEEGEGGEE